eukprot:TRINITY_DN31190_c0_g1_i1.p1 TRINITY_DN31190_c0_g1~~TRINITY_DN31190_c0_g1_i1.p1  ORF type:complete len:140 (+),score=13.46 TRINITY_DN31190_c0_g1_i1:56-475(+)
MDLSRPMLPQILELWSGVVSTLYSDQGDDSAAVERALRSLGLPQYAIERLVHVAGSVPASRAGCSDATLQRLQVGPADASFISRHPHAAEDCAICMECMQSTEKVRACALDCGHVFHLPCVSQWLRLRAVCPTCRAPVR